MGFKKYIYWSIDDILTMLCSFLLYNKVNQLYIHIYQLFLKIPSLYRSLQSIK